MPPIDPASIPASCAAIAVVPADATGPQPAIEARIALASCAAEQSFNALTVTPDDAGIAALTAAAKPSMAMLDAAVAANDPIWTPIAQRTRAGLWLAQVVRIRASVPAITVANQTQGMAAHNALEPKIKPWLDAAH